MTARADDSAERPAAVRVGDGTDPLVTISPEGKITDVNEAAVLVTGVARAQLVGTDFSDYFTEPDLAREGYRQVFAHGFVTDYPLTIRQAGGDPLKVLFTAPVCGHATQRDRRAGDPWQLRF